MPHENEEPTTGRVMELLRQPKLQAKLEATRVRLPAIIEGAKRFGAPVLSRKDILNDHARITNELSKVGLSFADIVNTPEIISELTPVEIWAIFPREEDPGATRDTQKQLIKTIAEINPESARDAIQKLTEFEPKLVSGTRLQQILIDPIAGFIGEKFVPREKLTAKEQRDKKRAAIKLAEEKEPPPPDIPTDEPDIEQVVQALMQPGFADIFAKLREEIGPAKQQEISPLFALAALISAAGQRLGGGPGALPLIQEQIRGQQQAEAQRQQKVQRVGLLEAQTAIQQRQEQVRFERQEARRTEVSEKEERAAIARDFPGTGLESMFIRNPEAVRAFIDERTKAVLQRLQPVK